jgi:hypothetical protein
LLFVLAHWVFAAAAFLLAPLALLRSLLCAKSQAASPSDETAPGVSRRHRWVRRADGVLASELGGALVLLGLGFGAGFLLMRLVHIACRTGLGTQPVTQWGETWVQLAGNAWADLAPHGWPVFLGGMALAGVLALAVPCLRRHALRAWTLAAALAGAALLYFLFLGTREWMALNSCCARYTRPSIFLLQAALLVAGLVPLGAALPGAVRKSLGALAVPLLLLAAVFGYGYPSLENARRQLDHTLGLCTNDILAARCTHVAGNYWTVWPVVFHANLAQYEQGQTAPVWGITTRCEETLGRWRDMPRDAARIAVAAGGDADADPYLSAIGFPVLEVAEKRPTVWVLRSPAVALQASLSSTLQSRASADHR